MDIRFKGASLPYYERILNTSVSQEDTAETIVPDALPDVAELLMTDGQSLIRGKDVHRSGVSVSGVSELVVLYRTEEGEVGRLPVEIPFETEISFNIAEDTAKVVSSVHLIGCEARILNSRKLLLRSEVCVIVSVWSPSMLRWAAEAEPEGCQVERKAECCTLRPVSGVEEKTFTAEESQAMPAGRPQAESLLSTRASLRWEEAEQVGRKLVVRGTAEITALYRTVNNEAFSEGFRLPWSAFLELPEGEKGLSWDLVTSLTGCSGELTEEGGFSFAVGGVVQAVIRREKEVSWISDAYGIDCAFTPEFETAEMDTEALSELKSENIHIFLNSMRKPRSLVYLTADCGRPRQDKENLRVPVHVKALCLMEDGRPEQLSGRGELVCAYTGSMPEVRCGEASGTVTPGGIETRIPVSIRQVRCSRRTLNLLTGAEVSERAERCLGPNMVLLRAAEGDSVWSLGKKKGIPCAAIKSYNQMAEGEEPAPGSLLLLAR